MDLSNAPKNGRGLLGVALPPILGIFLTVFLDLLSFGLFIPDLQLRGRLLATQALGPAATATQIGFITGATLAVFSLAQLLTSPLLGRLSDHAGRRSVLLVTCALSCVSYLVYAHATQLWVVILARILCGVAAANLGVAFAYIADITTPENRAKGMGMVGAAFGLGFILGPVAGAFLLQANGNSPLLLGYVGAALEALNFFYVLLLLPESREGARRETHILHDFKIAFATPGLALLLAMFFALNLGFTNLESTFFQLLAAPNWIYHQGDHARQTGGYILGMVGVVSVIMQGIIVRRVVAKHGEVKVLRMAYLGYAPILALTPFLPLWMPMVGGVVLMGVCMGLAQPSLSSLISRFAPKDLQGGVFGVTQGLGAFARFAGPLIANSIFAWRPFAPYLLGATIILFPAVASWRVRPPSDSNDEG